MLARFWKVFPTDLIMHSWMIATKNVIKKQDALHMVSNKKYRGGGGSKPQSPASTRLCTCASGITKQTARHPYNPPHSANWTNCMLSEPAQSRLVICAPGSIYQTDRHRLTQTHPANRISWKFLAELDARRFVRQNRCAFDTVNNRQQRCSVIFGGLRTDSHFRNEGQRFRNRKPGL